MSQKKKDLCKGQILTYSVCSSFSVLKRSLREKSENGLQGLKNKAKHEVEVFCLSSRQSVLLNNKFFQVKLIRLVGMMLLVYVAEKHRKAVGQVEAHYVGTGLLGRMVREIACFAAMAFILPMLCSHESQLTCFDVQSCLNHLRK